MLRLDQRAALRSTLTTTMHANEGALHTATARSIATHYGIGLRTVEREAARLRAALITPLAQVDPFLHQAGAGALAEGVVGRLPATATGVPWWNDDEATREVLAALAGAVTTAAAWRQLCADGVVSCGYPSFTRQLKKHLPPAVHAGLTSPGRDKGREGYLNASLYCTLDTGHRNTRWQADCLEVPVRVLLPNGSVAESVWLIAFIDEATRVLTAWSMTVGRPGGEDVRATLAAGVASHLDSAGNVIGGLPQAVMWDNGREFLNDAVTHTCIALGIAPTPAPPKSGWRKGKIERFFRTIEDMFLSSLPGAVHGPRTFTGRRPWRGEDRDLHSFEGLRGLTAEWIERYNTEHQHSSIGSTPIAKWNADPTALRLPEPEQLHPLMLVVPATRVVAKDGVSYANIKWLAPEMRMLRRRRVEIRVLPGEATRIHGFDPRTGEYLFTAGPAAQLSVEQRRELIRARNEDYDTIRAALDAGTMRRQEDALIRQVLDDEAAALTAAPTPPANEPNVDLEPPCDAPREEPGPDEWPDLNLDDLVNDPEDLP